MPKGVSTFDFPSFSTVADYHIRTFSKLPEHITWRTVRYGLNLQGICKNKKCQAFEKKVVSPQGFGKFEVAKLIQKTRCVVCSKFMHKVQGVIISQCSFIGKGMKVKEGDETDSESDEDEEIKEIHFEFLSNSPHNCIVFGDLEKEIIQWYYLDLVVTKPQRKCPNKHPLPCFQRMTYDWVCNKCHKNLSRNEIAKRCQICHYHVCFECLK